MRKLFKGSGLNKRNIFQISNKDLINKIKYTKNYESNERFSNIGKFKKIAILSRLYRTGRTHDRFICAVNFKLTNFEQGFFRYRVRVFDDFFDYGYKWHDLTFKNTFWTSRKKLFLKPELVVVNISITSRNTLVTVSSLNGVVKAAFSMRNTEFVGGRRRSAFANRVFGYSMSSFFKKNIKNYKIASIILHSAGYRAKNFIIGFKAGFRTAREAFFGVRRKRNRLRGVRKILHRWSEDLYWRNVDTCYLIGRLNKTQSRLLNNRFNLKVKWRKKYNSLLGEIKAESGNLAKELVYLNEAKILYFNNKYEWENRLKFIRDWRQGLKNSIVKISIPFAGCRKKKLKRKKRLRRIRF